MGRVEESSVEESGVEESSAEGRGSAAEVPRPADSLRLIRAIPTMFRVAFAETAAYQAEMVIWILSATLPLVMLAIWDAAASEGPLQGFGQVEFARYFTVTLFVRHVTSVWVVWEMNEAVRTGSLSTWLLRPIHPLHWLLAETLAVLPFRMLVLTPILGALVLWRPELLFVPDLENVGLFALSVVLAFIVSWTVQCILGCLAFWFEQSTGAFNVWFAVWGFMSGYLVPAPLLPEGLAEAARYLPFRASLGAPVEILLGADRNPAETVAIQVGWVVLLLGCSRIAWRLGVRRYGAVGA